MENAGASGGRSWCEQGSVFARGGYDNNGMRTEKDDIPKAKNTHAVSFFFLSRICVVQGAVAVGMAVHGHERPVLKKQGLVSHLPLFLFIGLMLISSLVFGALSEKKQAIINTHVASIWLSCNTSC